MMYLGTPADSRTSVKQQQIRVLADEFEFFIYYLPSPKITNLKVEVVVLTVLQDIADMFYEPDL